MSISLIDWLEIAAIVALLGMNAAQMWIIANVADQTTKFGRLLLKVRRLLKGVE